MAYLVAEAVRLARNQLPTLALFTAEEVDERFCRAQVFLIAPQADIPVFGRAVEIGERQVSAPLAMAIAKEIARRELVSRLHPDALESIEFEPADVTAVRAARCLNEYSTLGGVPNRSTSAYDELRDWINSVSVVRTNVSALS